MRNFTLKSISKHFIDIPLP